MFLYLQAIHLRATGKQLPGKKANEREESEPKIGHLGAGQ